MQKTAIVVRVGVTSIGITYFFVCYREGETIPCDDYARTAQRDDSWHAPDAFRRLKDAEA